MSRSGSAIDAAAGLASLLARDNGFDVERLVPTAQTGAARP